MQIYKLNCGYGSYCNCGKIGIHHLVLHLFTYNTANDDIYIYVCVSVWWVVCLFFKKLSAKKWLVGNGRIFLYCLYCVCVLTLIFLTCASYIITSLIPKGVPYRFGLKLTHTISTIFSGIYKIFTVIPNGIFVITKIE